MTIKFFKTSLSYSSTFIFEKKNNDCVYRNESVNA